MEASTIVLYGALTLFGIIGYFIKDKQKALEDSINKLADKLDQHEKDDIAQHTRLLEARIEAQTLFVTRQEFNDTVSKIFHKLDEIAKDIRDLLTNKADKE